MKVENLIQAMQLFVGDDPLMEMFHKPYAQKGFYYATDAHALIRVDGSFNLDLKSQERPKTEDVIKPNTIDPVEININELDDYLKSITPEVEDTKECEECITPHTNQRPILC